MKDFKARVTEIKNTINTGTYIEKRSDTIKSIATRHIQQKLNDGITKGISFKREMETLSLLEKCCEDFINRDIQKVTLYDIQSSKENMKQYKQSVIDKMWQILGKVFAIASSPSIHLIPFNLMQDENLKKPLSNQKTKKVYPFTKEEREKLEYVLNNQERNHKYRNIVMLEWLTSMRIGEVLARSKDDIDKKQMNLHIHNTLTKDENGNVILGEHTKTYNKETGIDEGERYFPLDNEDIKDIISEELSKKITNIHNLLFWDYEKNTFISPQEVNSWLYRLNQKYHITQRLHNHKLRHDRLTQWAELGMDLRAIQYLGGHVEGSNVTDSVYIDVSQEYAFKEYKKAK